MNPEIKAKWVAALRSGKYQQGTGYLKRREANSAEYQHCCLGVLCELALEDGLKITTEERPAYMAHNTISVTFGIETTTLPPEVSKWAGMTDGAPRVKCDNVANPDDPILLSELNDGSYRNGRNSATFDEIADLIEDQL